MATLEDKAEGWHARRIEALIDAETPVQESPTLEFKRGEKLGRDSKLIGALVKQVTGMSNAGGGTILYGIEEGEIDGITTAIGMSPVTERKLDADWLASVVHGWTAPPMRTFKVTQVPVDNGFVLAVDVAQGLTAHQSLYDHKYYQRGARSTEPMLDHQIRDVMGRRTSPTLATTIAIRNTLRSASLHRYRLGISLSNVGLVRAQAWRIEVDLPVGIFDEQNGIWSHALGMLKVMRTATTVGHDDIDRFAFSAGSSVPRGFEDIYPGQKISLDGSVGLPDFCIMIDDEAHRNLKRTFGPPIRYRHYSADQPATEYEIPFEEWCRF